MGHESAVEMNWKLNWIINHFNKLFPPMTMNSWHMNLTYKCDLNRIKVKHHPKYLGQQSFRSKFIVWRYTHTHILWVMLYIPLDTNNTPFWRRSSQPISWSSTKETKSNTTNTNIHPEHKDIIKLECGPMPNLMVALPSIGSTPQSLADAHY